MTCRSRGLLQFLVILLACACGVAAQSKDPDALAVGRILVAPRDSPDPIFAKSVILLVRYDKTGALGLMVNHRTKVPISRALSGLKDAAGHADPVFVGGPVELDTVFALIRSSAKPEGATEIVAHVYFVAAKTALINALDGSTNPNELRIYLGYSGWAPQQLENEVRNGGWYIFQGSEAVAFDAKPDTLWSRMIQKTEQRFARLGPGPARPSRTFDFLPAVGNLHIAAAGSE